MTFSLNRLLTLEDRQRTPNASGGYAEDWVPLGELWAEVQLRSGRGTDYGDLATGRVSYRIILRGAPMGDPARPHAGQRLREGDRIYSIDAVSERDAKGRYLVCFATEEVAA